MTGSGNKPRVGRVFLADCYLLVSRESCHNLDQAISRNDLLLEVWWEQQPVKRILLRAHNGENWVERGGIAAQPEIHCQRQLSLVLSMSSCRLPVKSVRNNREAERVQ